MGVWGSLSWRAHARTAVMLTRKGGWQHRLQILREAESILNPDEPWPYTELVAEDYPNLPPVDDALDTFQVHSDGDEDWEIEDATYGDHKDVDAEDAEERKALATSSRKSTAKSNVKGGMKRPASIRRSTSARLKARRRTEGSADMSVDESASERSRASTPAADAESTSSNSPSPAARRAAAAAMKRSREAQTPRPPSPLQAAGKYRMLRCV